MDISISEAGVDRTNGERIKPKQLSRFLLQAQVADLDDTLCGKTIHGVFFKQAKQDEWDTAGSHAWFLDGRLKGETEGLIVAAQDGVIHTRAYQARVMKKPISPLCRGCHGREETIGHLLSNCPLLNWTLYKERHDRVLYKLVLALCRRHTIRVPERLKWRGDGWSGVAILEGENLKLCIDISIPTDRQMKERRPDLIVFDKSEKRISIFDVACAWEPLLIEREKEKRGKYQELARDLATQWAGWKTSVVPIVVGDLGSLAGFRKELKGTGLLSSREVSFLARNCQFEVLCSAVRIIRRQLCT